MVPPSVPPLPYPLETRPLAVRRPRPLEIGDTEPPEKHGRVGHVFTTSCTLRLLDGSQLPAGVNQDLEELEHYHEGSVPPESLVEDS